jgi:hypothetical protein
MEVAGKGERLTVWRFDHSQDELGLSTRLTAGSRLP